MHKCQHRLAATAFTLILFAAAQPAAAQLAAVVYSVGELDDKDVTLILAGASLAFQRLGWSPVFDLQGHWLRYPNELGSVTTVAAITPSIGIKHTFSGADLQFRVGYSFQEEAVTRPINVVVDVGSGVINVAQFEYWGSGRLGAQAIATYNYGAETFWGRGRLTQRVFPLGERGHVRLGAEAAYLSARALEDRRESTQLGGLLGFVPRSGLVLYTGAGRKLQDGADATYVKIEFVFLPGR
jgi:hypothetical protein